MEAAYVEQLGPAESIRYGELPDPVPTPDEVLVAVEAVAVNAVDTLVRSGRWRTEVPLPLVVGRDLVGTVVGSDERIWCNSLGHAGRQGAAATLAVVPRDRLYPLPAGVDAAQAAAVLHPAATAWISLTAHAALAPGETLYVAGGNGSVGSCLVAAGKQLGAHVVAAARDAPGQARCADAGADEVLAAADGPAAGSVDVHVDTTGRVDLADACATLRTGGRVLVVAGGERSTALPGTFYTRDISVLGFVISRASVGQLADAARWINALLGRGWRLPVETMRLSATREAHRRAEQGDVPRVSGAHGRLVLLP